MSEANELEMTSGRPELSKRAARRLIQRAFVLVGRERAVRQHWREAELTTLWVLGDWDLEWTIVLHRGKLEFDRRPTRKPDVTLSWPTAEGFFQWIESNLQVAEGFTIEGTPESCRLAEVICRAFRTKMGQVLHFPFDDDGVRLA